MRIPVALILALSAGSAWADHEAEYQPNEVSLNVDVLVANQSNEAVVVGQYTYSPGQKVNRWDIVHPALRRFVRAAPALWFRAGHDGSNIETWSGAWVGGLGYLAGGRLYGRAETGIVANIPTYDSAEGGYITIPLKLEAGFRPTPLFSVGVTGEFDPIVGNLSPDDTVIVPVVRSGQEGTLGLTTTLATSDDRLLLTLHGAYRQARWSFVGLDPGTTDVDGMRAGFELAIQATPTFSWIVRGNFLRERWNDQRAGDSDPTVVGDPLDRVVYGGGGDVGILFWYKGQTGFRVALGGGYMQKRPLIHDFNRGMGSISIGVERRF